jgi:hypothetical protein
MVPVPRISPNVKFGRLEMVKWAKVIRAANQGAMDLLIVNLQELSS